MSAVIPVLDAGAMGACERCGEKCKVAADKNPAAMMLRHSAVPRGLCVNCAVAEFFLAEGLREMNPDPSDLRFKPIQDQFAKVMFSHISDAKPPEINWEKVIQNWDLPFRVGARNMHDPKADPSRPHVRRTRKRA